jgi:hypothetical protein
VPDLVGRGVGRERDVVAAAGVADEDVAGLQDRRDRVAAVGERGALVTALAVAGQVDRDGLVAESLEFPDHPLPAPGAVEPAVDEHEPHDRKLPSASRPAVPARALGLDKKQVFTYLRPIRRCKEGLALAGPGGGAGRVAPGGCAGRRGRAQEAARWT